MLDFVLKMLDFVLKMLDFVLKMLDFAGCEGAALRGGVQVRSLRKWWFPVFKMMDFDGLCIENDEFVFKMMNFIWKLQRGKLRWHHQGRRLRDPELANHLGEHHKYAADAGA